MTKTYNNIKDRVYGAIIGFAIGDALGAATESYTEEEISLKYYGVLKDMVGGGMFNWNKGQYTDDTEMMITIGYEALKEEPNYAKAILDWADTKPRDIGMSMRQVLNRLPENYRAEDGGTKMLEVADEVNTEYQSLGSGALVRALVPILLNIMSEDALIWPFCEDYKKYCEQDFIKQGKFTHSDNAEFVGNYQKTMYWILYENTISKPNAFVSNVGMINGAVTEILDVATKYASKHNIEWGYIDIINRGGDTDSCAAVYGSMVGLKYGLSGLMEYPRINNWIITMLTNNHKYNILDLCEKVTSKCWEVVNNKR